jgi:hypothetical protein
MAKSSVAIPLLLLPLGAAAAQPAITAEAALENQQRQVERAVGTDCRRSTDDSEIIVCGRSMQAYRVPFPDERVPGERRGLLPGEAPSGVSALSANTSPCSTTGPNQRCSGGLDFLAVGSVLIKAIKHFTREEEE